MGKRTFVNPNFYDTATFIRTSEEFEVAEVILYVQVGKEKKVLKVGEPLTVPASTPHGFYNETNDTVNFQIALKPGHTGMENFIKIFYGLASDGLSDKKVKPKNFARLAVARIISDSNAQGWMSLLSPVIRIVANRAKIMEPKNGCWTDIAGDLNLLFSGNTRKPDTAFKPLHALRNRSIYIA